MEEGVALTAPDPSRLLLLVAPERRRGPRRLQDRHHPVWEAGGGRRGRQEAALQLVEAGHLHRRYYAEIPVQRAHQAGPNCSLSGLPTLLLARLLPQLTQNGNTVERCPRGTARSWRRRRIGGIYGFRLGSVCRSEAI